MPNVVGRLRCAIGAVPEPLAPLPRRPRKLTAAARRRFDHIRTGIHAIEVELVEYLTKLNETLDRRIRSRRRLYRW